MQIAGRSFTISQAGSEPFAMAGRAWDVNGVPQARVRIAFVRDDDADGLAPVDVFTDEQGRWNQSGFAPGPAYRVLASRGRESFNPFAYVVSGPTASLNFTEANRRIILPFAR
jgi:hypothetical protein